MKDHIQVQEGSRARVNQKHPVRLTALIYLKEALLAERYEECKELVDIAKEFGAKEMDLRILLEDARREAG